MTIRDVPMEPHSLPQNPSYAFFVQDVGGWWTHKGIFEDKEQVISLLENFKHTRHVRSILVVELPGGKKAYEWER